MKMRTFYPTLLLILLVSITGCQKKVIYITPQITGQVIDKQTNRPIEGVKTVIGGPALDYTNEQGRFSVPPITSEYIFNKPNHRLTMAKGGASFTIYKSGYEIKSYANGGLSFIPNKPYTEKIYVNMGKVYLNPVPVGKEGEYETYYLTLDFCKPDESQREVDCIPVPEGKTYAEVSPNRSVQ